MVVVVVVVVVFLVWAKAAGGCCSHAETLVADAHILQYKTIRTILGTIIVHMNWFLLLLVGRMWTALYYPIQSGDFVHSHRM